MKYKVSKCLKERNQKNVKTLVTSRLRYEIAIENQQQQHYRSFFYSWVSVCERGNIGLAWLSLPLSTQPNDKSIFTLCDEIKYQADRKNANTRSPIFFLREFGWLNEIHSHIDSDFNFLLGFIHPSVQINHLFLFMCTNELNSPALSFTRTYLQRE